VSELELSLIDKDRNCTILSAETSVALWHKEDLRLAAPEGPHSNGLPTFSTDRFVTNACRSHHASISCSDGSSPAG
jgi:hypothetical protein